MGGRVVTVMKIGNRYAKSAGRTEVRLDGLHMSRRRLLVVCYCNSKAFPQQWQMC